MEEENKGEEIEEGNEDRGVPEREGKPPPPCLLVFHVPFSHKNNSTTIHMRERGKIARGECCREGGRNDEIVRFGTD